MTGVPFIRILPGGIINIVTRDILFPSWSNLLSYKKRLIRVLPLHAPSCLMIQLCLSIEFETFQNKTGIWFFLNYSSPLNLSVWNSFILELLTNSQKNRRTLIMLSSLIFVTTILICSHLNGKFIRVINELTMRHNCLMNLFTWRF